VEAETHLLIWQRYIELNPVRAGMVSDPSEYRWSSYRHHAFGAADPILTPHALYIAHGPNEAERREIYRGLFTEALDEAPINDLRKALNQNQPIGNLRFYAQIQAITGQPRELRKPGRPRKQRDSDSANVCFILSADTCRSNFAAQGEIVRAKANWRFRPKAVSEVTRTADSPACSIG
jgi:putative transposase